LYFHLSLLLKCFRVYFKVKMLFSQLQNKQGNLLEIVDSKIWTWNNEIVKQWNNEIMILHAGGRNDV